MIRRLRPIVALAAGCALLINLAAAPAAASTTPYHPWYAAPCATGGFGQLEIDAQNNAIIPGEVTICGRWDTKYSFTVVAFRPDRDFALAFSTNLRSFAQTGPTTVRAGFVTPPSVGTTAICLMRSVYDRVACLAVDVDAQYRITSRPLSTGDPLVTKAVIYQDDVLSPGPIQGHCATCVSLPV
jgi:hypothetical protein